MQQIRHQGDHFKSKAVCLERTKGIKKKEKEMGTKLYQIGLDRGADPQLVPFLLHFLDEVDEHVCLRQVL